MGLCFSQLSIDEDMRVMVMMTMIVKVTVMVMVTVIVTITLMMMMTRGIINVQGLCSSRLTP